MSALYVQMTTQEWDRRIRLAGERMLACNLCPWQCNVNRLESPQAARCKTGSHAMVASYGPSYAEESCLTGETGSGAIFFGMCNLQCVFCQNHAISQQGRGYLPTAEELAEIMLFLQKQGCSNLNLISPTHVLPQILSALKIAALRGLQIPLVYNTSGFERVEILRELLDGIVDIYLPDLKFANPELSARYMSAPQYVDFCKSALFEMQRQVGEAIFDDQKIMRHGMVIRHVVMPGFQEETKEVVDFIASQISPQVWVSFLRYQPTFQTQSLPPLDRRLTEEEFQSVLHLAGSHGLKCLDTPSFVIQE